MFESFRRLSEDMFNVDKQPRNDSPLSVNEEPEMLGVPRTPRLDLDLPNPTFERYSVMFEKVLEEPKPSLLERRQSRLQRNRSTKRLDTVIDESDAQDPVCEGGQQQASASPYIKKALSIRVNGINRPRPIQRSKTAPPGAVSPVAKGFSNPKIAVMANSPASQSFIEGSLPPTPMTLATLSDSDSVAVINDDLRQAKSETDQSEPSWDMVTSEPATVSPKRRRNPYLRVKSPDDLERQMVQVSVARQVSVSKARKQVEKSLPSKQPLRPKVVELSKNRKSTVVLIESGDD